MTTPPSKWSVAQVADWLASVGLEPEHVNLFTKQEINGEALFEMQTEHFTELGIPMGVRLRVQKHIAAFKDVRLLLRRRRRRRRRLLRIEESLDERMRGCVVVPPSIKDIQVSDPREFQHVSGVQFDEGEFVGRGEVPESVKNVLEERGAKIRPGAKPPLPAKNAAAPAVAASATAVAAAAASGAAADVPAKPVPAAPKPHAGASASSGAQFKLAKVLFDYEAQTDEELTVTCGQQVRILEQDESGWWHAATADGATTGFVPGEFVEFISTAATESTQPPSEAAAETKPVGETTGVAATETVTATSTSGTTATTTAASSETTAKADGEEEKAKVSVEE